MADGLFESLNEDYTYACGVLAQILGPENEEETGMFTNYYWLMPVAKLVEKYGLDHFDLSMRMIEEITKRNTGEYTIRPFVEKHQEKTMEQMARWSLNTNFHVRRLACEGSRPRLPWAAKLQCFIDDPAPLLSTLNQLKDDESKYVQNSVANCINDIFKDNFDVAKDLIDSWIFSDLKNVEVPPQRKWIIRHAIRNFRKKNVDWALKMTTDLK